MVLLAVLYATGVIDTCCSSDKEGTLEIGDTIEIFCSSVLIKINLSDQSYIKEKFI